MTDRELPEIAEGLVLKPGDRLIVRVGPMITRGQVDEVLGALRKRLPDVEVTVIAAEQIAAVRHG